MWFRVWCSGRLFVNSNKLLGSIKSRVFVNWPNYLLKHICRICLSLTCAKWPNVTSSLISLPENDLFCVKCRSWSSSSCSTYHPPHTSSTRSTSTFLSTLFSNMFCLRSFVMWVENIHTHMKEPAKFNFPNIILMFWIYIPNGKTKDSRLNGSSHSFDLIRSKFLHEYDFDLLVSFKYIWFCLIFKKNLLNVFIL
jgi:hypothetical protein